ncbi:hypothetical protein SFRURICE_003601 [Spodoptera frugiperda]|nr:hypothetical protein SFRURICE_003601 [Spodoptera frugiperda]
MEAGNPFQMDPVTKLKELRDAVGRGEIDEVKNIVKWFEQDVDRIRTLLPAAYVEARTCPTQDDLVIAACSHNQKHYKIQTITRVMEKRTEAVRHALRLEDFEMVVKLYDYWIGDLYWKGHEKDNFKMLGKILNGANSPKTLFGWQELYNTLPKPLSHDAAADDTAAEGTTVKETARVILNLLSIYDKYSDVDSEPTMTSMPTRNQKNFEILLDAKYLTPMMYMREHYSLRKNITYDEDLEQTTGIDIIIFERVLQVIEEMLKNPTESSHISDLTKADTIHHLQGIREFLSRTDAKNELVKIEKLIDPILDLYKSVLDKLSLQKGLDLLNNRIKNMPVGARQRLDEVTSLFKERGNDSVSASGQYFKEVWEPAGLSHQLLKEIPMLIHNRDDISLKKIMVDKDIEDKTEKTLEVMRKYNDSVDNITLAWLCRKRLLESGLLTYSPLSEDYRTETKPFIAIKNLNKNIVLKVEQTGTKSGRLAQRPCLCSRDYFQSMLRCSDVLPCTIMRDLTFPQTF